MPIHPPSSINNTIYETHTSTCCSNEVGIGLWSDTRAQSGRATAQGAKDTLSTLKPVDRNGGCVQLCMEGTRENMLEEIEGWLQSVKPTNILRLTGIAHRPYFVSILMSVLKMWALEPGRPYVTCHFEFLTTVPLRTGQEHSSLCADYTIIIDAMDECDSDPSQAGLWMALSNIFKLTTTGCDRCVSGLCRSSWRQNEPFAEAKIYTGTKPDMRTNHHNVFNIIIHCLVSDCFSLLLEHYFAEIRCSSPLGQPTRQTVDAIATFAIWVAVPFIRADRVRPVAQDIPDKRLEWILGGLGAEQNIIMLCRQILELSSRDVHKRVMTTILTTKTSFDVCDSLSILHPNESVNFNLDRLSVIHGTVICICHMSLTDFLCDSHRKEFYNDEKRHNLSPTYFQMKEKPGFNFCGSEESRAGSRNPHTSLELIARRSLLDTSPFLAVHIQDTPTNPKASEYIKYIGFVRFLVRRSAMEAMVTLDRLRVVSGSDTLSLRNYTRAGKIVNISIQHHIYCGEIVAFSLDGMHVVSGSSDTTIRVWDAQTWKMVSGPIQSRIDYVRSVTYSRDDKQSEFSSDDQAIAVWNVQTGHMIWDRTRGHTDVAFSPDGRRIVSSSDNQLIPPEDPKTKEIIFGPNNGLANYITSVGFPPNGRQAIFGPDKFIRKAAVSIIGILRERTANLIDLATIARRCSDSAMTSYRGDITTQKRFGDDTLTKLWDLNPRYRFTQSHLRFLGTFADVRDQPGWIFPTAAKILVNITQTDDMDTWSGQVEGSEERGMFLSNSVEPV